MECRKSCKSCRQGTVTINIGTALSPISHKVAASTLAAGLVTVLMLAAEQYLPGQYVPSPALSAAISTFVVGLVGYLKPEPETGASKP